MNLLFENWKSGKIFLFAVHYTSATGEDGIDHQEAFLPCRPPGQGYF
ncbi:MAG: hypothetical protein N2314_01815 [Brevinematales bacterium]|nr:hypothetical protein [Brevinematales bacterium]